MSQKTIKACCALLAMVFVAGAARLMITPAYARYESAVYVKTVYEAKEKITKSDCLAPAEEEMTVLIGKINDTGVPIEISFVLKAEGAMEKGALSWTVAGDEYIDVEMRNSEGTVISSDTSMELSEGAEKTFTMVITPELESPNEDVDIAVNVRWAGENGTLAGKFAMVYPGTEDGINLENPSEGSGVVTETVEETMESLAAVPAKEAPTEENEAETVTSEKETTPTEGVEVTAPEDAAEAEGTEQETEEITVDIITGVSETMDSLNSAAPVLKITTLSYFDPERILPAKMKFGSNIDSVVFSLGTNEDGTAKKFPAKTKYSTDGGKSFTMLYYGDVINADVKDLAELSLVLDLSHTGLGAEADFNVRAQAFRENGDSSGSCSVEVKPEADAFCTAVIRSREENTEVSSEEQTDGVLSYEQESKFLTKDKVLEITFPEWTGAELEYSIEILSITDSGPEYVPVDLSSKGLSVTDTAEEDIHTLLIEIGKVLPTAGTYRVNVDWKYENICFYSEQINFFINYSLER